MAEVAGSRTARGEVTLRRRDDGALELRVNGVFVMDTLETTSERLLATMTLGSLAHNGPWSVFVGGLGLGFTLAEVLHDDRVGRVLVAEIEEAVASWHRSGLVPPPTPLSPQKPPGAASTLDDPRVKLVVADVREVMAQQPAASLDAILLDIDNGPGFLVYDANATVYDEPFLTSCATALVPGGVVALWSSDESPALLRALGHGFAQVSQRAVPVTLGSRQTTYHLLFGHRASR